MLDRLIHIGVDPALPRHETKHIVLTNAFALGYFITYSVAALSPTSTTLDSLVRVLNAAVSWFAFPSTKRMLSVFATTIDFLSGVVLTWRLHVAPPTPPSTYNLNLIAFGNRGLFFVLIVTVCVYAAREMARVEKALVAEREKTKSLLEKELSHQVAERSRELGEALARVGTAAPVQLTVGERFHTRYRVPRRFW